MRRKRERGEKDAVIREEFGSRIGSAQDRIRECLLLGSTLKAVERFF